MKNFFYPNSASFYDFKKDIGETSHILKCYTQFLRMPNSKNSNKEIGNNIFSPTQ